MESSVPTAAPLKKIIHCGQPFGVCFNRLVHALDFRVWQVAFFGTIFDFCDFLPAIRETRFSVR
jgi:hypothetical protein